MQITAPKHLSNSLISNLNQKNNSFYYLSCLLFSKNLNILIEIEESKKNIKDMILFLKKVKKLFY